MKTLTHKIKRYWQLSSIVFLWQLFFDNPFKRAIDEWLKINWKILCSYQYERFTFVARPGTGFKSAEDFEYLVTSKNSRRRNPDLRHQVTAEHYEKYKNRDGLQIVGIYWLPNPQIYLNEVKIINPWGGPIYDYDMNKMSLTHKIKMNRKTVLIFTPERKEKPRGIYG